MKLGILTFHSQLNYVSPSRMRARGGDYAGCGVLQCWALKRELEGMGHDLTLRTKNLPAIRRCDFLKMDLPIKYRLICEGSSEWTYIQRLLSAEQKVAAGDLG